MSRSIEVLPHAMAAVYFEWHSGYCHECESIIESRTYCCEDCGSEIDEWTNEPWMITQLFEDVRNHLMYEYPDFDPCEIPVTRETLIILTSRYCDIAITLHCGIVCLSVLHKTDIGGGIKSGGEILDYLEARAWCDKNIIPFLRNHYATLIPLSTMSNGETIYTRVGD